MERLTEELNPAYPTPKHFGTRHMQKIVSSLADYERIGLTPEQIRELADRDEAKTPMYEIYGDQGDGTEPDCWICPNCETEYDIDDEYDFCPNCGQRILR